MNTRYFVYGVVAPDVLVPASLSGLDSAKVYAVVYQRAVGAVVSEIDADRPRRRQVDSLAYARVLDALAASGPVIPLAFGSDVELRAGRRRTRPGAEREPPCRALGPTGRPYSVQRAREPRTPLSVVRDDALAEVLEIFDTPAHRRAGGAEEGRAVPGHRSRPAARPADGDVDMVLRALAPQVVAHLERSPQGDCVLDVAMLVDLARRTEFEVSFDKVAERVRSRLRLTLAGPVPAYDFIEGGKEFPWSWH